MMDCKLALTKRDEEMIKAKVMKNDETEGAIDIDTTYRLIMNDWSGAKNAGLFELFGGKLILSKEIEIEKSVDLLWSDLFENNSTMFVDEIRSRLYKAFREDKIDRTTFITLRDLTYSEQVVLNRIENAMELDMGELSNKPFKISKGMKAMKVLQKLSTMLDMSEAEFEKFRLLHSQVLNNKMLKGTLCLSIHPMDYMTMSDNANNWESCMSWDDGGCYRAGTLECMNSVNTIVAYLVSDSREYEVSYGQGLYWNSKKYRQLVHINKDMIMTNKGYPYRNDQLSEIVLNWVAELAGERYEGKNYSEDDCENGELPEKIKRIDVYTDAMYNDFHNSAYAFFRFAKDCEPDAWGEVSLDISEGYGANCLCCGEKLYDSDGLYCDECVDFEYCDCCGERIRRGDETYYLECGDNVCQCCYEDHCSYCEECDSYYYNDDVSYIDREELDKLVDGDRKCEGYYCVNCQNNFEYKEEEEEQ